MRAPQSIELTLALLLTDLGFARLSCVWAAGRPGNGFPLKSIARIDRERCKNRQMCFQPTTVKWLFFKEIFSTTPNCSWPRLPDPLFGSFLFCLACSTDLQPTMPDKMTRTPSSVRPQLSII